MEVFKLNVDSYEGYLDFENGVLHRISSRIYLAEWFGLGSHFGKVLVLAPNVPPGPKGHDYKIDLAWNWLTAQK